MDYTSNPRVFLSSLSITHFSFLFNSLLTLFLSSSPFLLSIPYRSSTLTPPASVYFSFPFSLSLSTLPIPSLTFLSPHLSPFPSHSLLPTSLLTSPPSLTFSNPFLTSPPPPSPSPSHFSSPLPLPPHSTPTNSPLVSSHLSPSPNPTPTTAPLTPTILTGWRISIQMREGTILALCNH